MTDFEELRQLVAFQQFGTLSAAADELRITQPTMTRSMRRLERELGVPLFDRSAKNRIALTPTGELAAKEAKKLVESYEHFLEKIRNNTNLSNELFGAVAPGPLRFLEHAAESNVDWRTAITVRGELIDPDAVLNELVQRKATMIITDREIDDPRVDSLYLGKELLGVAIDKFNPLAQRPSASFADLAAQHSDCSSARRGGDLGTYARTHARRDAPPPSPPAPLRLDLDARPPPARI